MEIQHTKKRGRITNPDKPQRKRGRPLKDKVKDSIFHITVNTNKRYARGDPSFQRDAQDLLDAMEKTISEEELHEIIKFHYTAPNLSAWTPDFIRSVDTEVVVEKGDQFDQLHCHAMVRIKHTTAVLIDLPALRKKLNGLLGFNVHIKVGVLKAQNSAQTLAQILQAYIRKNVDSDEEESGSEEEE